MNRSLALVLPLLIACTQRGAVQLSTYTEDLSLLTADDYAAQTVLVGFTDDDWRSNRPVQLGDDHLFAMREWEAMRGGEYEVPAGEDALDVVERLRASGRYTFVEPDLYRHTTADPYRAYQWNMDTIRTSAAHGTTTGAGAVVAVVDTGVSSAGEDTPSLASGWDFVGGDSDATDENGHGTHVSGTIAGPVNGLGVEGVAPDADIMPVRVLDASGSGTSSDVIDGIVWAADHGADVINMSLGSSYGSAAEEAAVDYAWSMGVFVAAASGNDGSRRSVSYPAAYGSAVAVGATDYRNQRTRYSNAGSALELMAPGGDTGRDDNGDGYADGILQETFESGSWGYYFWQGTSMATPHVAGAAALLSSLGATNDEIRSTLVDTAVDLGTIGWDSYTGYGLIDTEAAVAAFGGSTGGSPGGSDTGTGGTGDTGTGTPVDPGTGGADTTAPAISGVGSWAHGPWLEVSFSTDEPATGQVCDNFGVCATTPLGTSHYARFRYAGSTFVVHAADTAGNSSTAGPYGF